MAQTLAQITKQIEKLQKEADALRQAELKGVVERIKVAISHYGLTPDQLGFDKPLVNGAKSMKREAKGSKAATPRFANGEGQVWSGRGPRPRWLREALANGRTLEEFSTDANKRSAKSTSESNQSSAVASEVSLPSANAVAKRVKVTNKKPRIAARAASSLAEGVSANVVAASAAAPQATRTGKSNLAKSARATKAASVIAKSAPRSKAKRTNPVSAAANKVTSVPGAALPKAAEA